MSDHPSRRYLFGEMMEALECFHDGMKSKIQEEQDEIEILERLVMDKVLMERRDVGELKGEN